MKQLTKKIISIFMALSLALTFSITSMTLDVIRTNAAGVEKKTAGEGFTKFPPENVYHYYKVGMDNFEVTSSSRRKLWCPVIQVYNKGGGKIEYYARIQIDSVKMTSMTADTALFPKAEKVDPVTKSSIEVVTTGGAIQTLSEGDGYSEFWIQVKPNEVNNVSAVTTAMSTPQTVHYSFKINLNDSSVQEVYEETPYLEESDVLKSGMGMARLAKTGPDGQVTSITKNASGKYDLNLVIRPGTRKFVRMAYGDFAKLTDEYVKNESNSVAATSFKLVDGTKTTGEKCKKIICIFKLTNITEEQLTNGFCFRLQQYNIDADGNQVGEAGWSSQKEEFTIKQKVSFVTELSEMIKKLAESPDYQSSKPEDAVAVYNYWNGLSADQQKEFKESDSEYKDYFDQGDDGDITKDKPRKEAPSEKEILVVSFGTSFTGSRIKTIGGIEDALEDVYSKAGYCVRRAFTSTIIMNHIAARDGEKYKPNSLEEALDAAKKAKVKELIIQPTHLMKGLEYEDIAKVLKNYGDADFYANCKIAEPLMGELLTENGDPYVNADKEAVAEALVNATAESAGTTYEAAKAANDTAYVYMGHGTSHTNNVTYTMMQKIFTEKYPNCFMATVEGEPADTACDKVMEAVKKAGYKKVILRPMMVVAGDHANNDMADESDPDSFVSRFKASGNFDSVVCQIEGLGQIPAVQNIYVCHVLERMITALASPESYNLFGQYEYALADDDDAKAVHDIYNSYMNKTQIKQFEEISEHGDYFETGEGWDLRTDKVRKNLPDKEKEILVVSFGTSFTDSRVADIGAIEDALENKYMPEGYCVRRAFTSKIIMNHIAARDGLEYKPNNLEEALKAANDSKVKKLVIQPTHLMKGLEYEDIADELKAFANATFAGDVSIAEPLLGELSDDTDSSVNADKAAVAKALLEDTAAWAGTTAKEAANGDTAYVFMGHGTAHSANESYMRMEQLFRSNPAYKNCFMSTVEGITSGSFDPSCEAVIKKVKDAGYKKAVLRPFMVVAGDHANNDMADEEDPESFVYKFKSSGVFDRVVCQIEGLGRIADIQKIYVDHTDSVISGKPEPVPADKDLKSATVKLSKTKFTYNGKVQKPKVTKVTVGNAVLSANDYSVSVPKSKNAGKYKVTVKAKGNGYKGSKTVSYSIEKGKTSFTAKASKAKVELSKVKKKNQTVTIKVTKLTAGSSACRFSVKSVSKGQKKKVSVNKKGVVTIKKGCKKCKIVISVSSKANKNRKALTKKVTVNVK